MASGVSAGDFTAILADLQRSVMYEVLTKTVDSFTGDETTTYAAPAARNVVFFNQTKKWLFDKEGLIEGGDAYIMDVPANGIKRYDKFSIGGDTYLIRNVIVRTVVGVAMFDIGVCFLTE